MTKTTLALCALTALAVPLTAQAETNTKTKTKTKTTTDTHSHAHASDKSKDDSSGRSTDKSPSGKGGGPQSVEINTAPGGQNAPTDIGAVSPKNRRDFVADPAGFSVGGSLGLGTQDSYGFGVGLKAGYTLPNRLYFGGVGNYHIGNQTEALGNTISNHVWYLGPEAGYDVGVGPVIVRPALGLGFAFRSQSANGPGLSNAGNQTDTRLYIAPGASVIAPIGNFFVGGDARIMFTTEETNLGLYAVGGAHL